MENFEPSTVLTKARTIGLVFVFVFMIHFLIKKRILYGNVEGTWSYSKQNEPLLFVTKVDPHPKLTMCCLYDGIRKGSSTRGFFWKSKRLIQINTAAK